MVLFAIATLCPVLLTFAAIFGGGMWGLWAVGSITVFTFAMDRLIAVPLAASDTDAEFPGSGALLGVLALAHFGLLGAAIWAIGGASGLSAAERGAVGLATALICGQVSHPVAHELIHKSGRFSRLAGQLIYTSILFGHHASAHLRVHHVHVGTASDPHSAPLGLGFYRFARRAWPGGFRAGLTAENRLRQGRPAWRHPYLWYVSGAMIAIALAGLAAGMAGLGAFVAISLYAQSQILMADYVQHYGLSRHQLADGRREPVGPAHSWNAPDWYSSAMMINAPRHSDHHITPSRDYPALQLDDAQMPCLPYALPVMAVIALFPELWRSVMDPLCARWQPGGTRPAQDMSPRDISPAVLAREKSSGMPGTVLPNSSHADVFIDPLSGLQRHASPRPKPDDSGGI